MSTTLRSKLNGMLESQSDANFLKAANLPKVPKVYNRPTINQVGN